MPVPKGFVSERLMPPGYFDSRSFRTTIVSSDARVVTGCEKGKWDNKRKRCRVGTKAQAIHRRRRGKRG